MPIKRSPSIELHRDGDNEDPVDSKGILLGWKLHVGLVGHGYSRYCKTHAGMQTNAAKLPWRYKRCAEIKTCFTIMLLLLWQKRSHQQCLSNPIPTTM